MAFIINQLDKICERNSSTKLFKGSAKFNGNFKFEFYKFKSFELNSSKLKKPLN